MSPGALLLLLLGCCCCPRPVISLPALSIQLPPPAEVAAACNATFDQSPDYPNPRHVVVIRHAEYLFVGDGESKTASGPALGVEGLLRSLALPFWYEDDLKDRIGWPDSFLTLGATLYDGLPNTTYSIREMQTVAPFISYLKTLNGTAPEINNEILSSQIDNEDQTPEAGCFLLTDPRYENATVMLAWGMHSFRLVVALIARQFHRRLDPRAHHLAHVCTTLTPAHACLPDHRYIQELLGVLVQQDSPAWGEVGDDDFSKVFLLSYADGAVDVEILHQPERVSPGAWDQYASAMGNGGGWLFSRLLLYVMFAIHSFCCS